MSFSLHLPLFPGLLQTIFDTLYDEDIISEEAFNSWHNSEDPKENEGRRKVCENAKLQSCKSCNSALMDLVMKRRYVVPFLQPS